MHGIGEWDNLYAEGRRSIKELKILTGLKDDFEINAFQSDFVRLRKVFIDGLALRNV